MRPSFFLLLAATISLPALACSAPAAEDVESSENAQTVNPTGPNGRATVTVTIPAFFTPTFEANGATYEYAFEFNGTSLQPGVPTLVVPASNAGNWGCLETTIQRKDRYSRVPIASAHECIWQLASGGSLTIELGIAKVWWSGYPQVRGDVFSIATLPRPTVARAWQDARYAQYAASSSRPSDYAFYAQNEVPLLLVAGDYEFSTANKSYPPKPFVVRAGQQTDMNADYDAFLATARIAYEDTEGFPDAATSPRVRCVNAEGRTAEGGSAGRWTEKLVMLDRDSVSCALVVAGGALSTPLPLSGGKVTSVALARLNVADVALVDEGNRLVKGKYNVRRKDGDTWSAPFFANKVQTHTGLDLPAGHYEVQVDYASAVGPKSALYEVDLVTP